MRGQSIDFSCPECNFTTKGSGKVYADMVDNNNLLVLVQYIYLQSQNEVLSKNTDTPI